MLHQSCWLSSVFMLGVCLLTAHVQTAENSPSQECVCHKSDRCQPPSHLLSCTPWEAIFASAPPTVVVPLCISTMYARGHSQHRRLHKGFKGNLNAGSRSGPRADRTPTQQNGAASLCTAADGEQRTMAIARSGDGRSAAAVTASDTATALDTRNNGATAAAAVDLGIRYNNGARATFAAAAVMDSARSGAGTGAKSGSDAAAAAAALEAARLERPRPAAAPQGETSFAAAAEEARGALQ